MRTMLSETFFASVCGPPITSKTNIPKEVGIYSYQHNPSFAHKASFKKSSTGPNSLALSQSHIFAAQNGKGQLHVYSRQKGNQETVVTFRERISSVALMSDVLLLGTAEGRLILWETCTGRQVSTPPCHVQAISCLAVTPYHVLTGSDDSNAHVWSTSRLLDLDSRVEHEPEQTLSNHRGAITSLVVGSSTNPETCMCVSASRDKTCVIWNYRTGEALRTLVFASAPLSLCLDPCGRGLYVSSEDGGVFAIEFFGDRPLLGSGSESMSVDIRTPLGTADLEDGPASCIAVSNDGTTLLTGHPKGKIFQWPLTSEGHPSKVADVNAAVTNIVFEPLVPRRTPTTALAVVARARDTKEYTFASQLQGNLAPSTAFSRLLDTKGIPVDKLEAAISALQQPQAPSNITSTATPETQTKNDEIWGFIDQLQTLQGEAPKK